MLDRRSRMSSAAMRLLIIVSLCVSFGITAFGDVNDHEDTIPKSEDEILQEGEKKISDQILTVLEHYKQDNPVGIPGAKIPDPMPIPDMKQSFSVAVMNFMKMMVYGLSKFKILHVRSEIAAMEVNAALKIDSLQVIGNYTMSTWLSRSQGPFTVNLTDVYVQGVANLAVERDGKLRAQDIKMDISFGNIAMNFENLGFMGNMFQGILNSVGTFLFESIKPFVLREAYTKIREEINKNLDKVAGDIQFPNSISPLDMVIIDARKKVRAMGLDPYKVKDYNSTVGMFGVELAHTWITGVSSFYRVGNISLSLENNTVIADFEIGTQKLVGNTQWNVVMISGMASRAGTASFSVEYIIGKFIIGQPLDTRRRPQFKDLQLELGNIQVRCDGAGTLDYIVEFVVNILPNLLRYQITDAIEGPVQEKVQKMFDTINVEELIKSKLPELDSMDTSGFKLSSLKQADNPSEHLDEDEFWNF